MVLEFGAIATIVGGLVEVAQMVSSRIPKKEPAGASDTRLDLEDRVAALEKNQAEQAGLVEKLAEQLENVAAAGEALNRRVAILLAISSAALLIGLVALLLASLR